MKRRLMSVAAYIAIAALGIGATVAGVAARRDSPTQDETVPKIVNVAVQIVQESSFEDFFSISGTLEPWNTVLLSAEYSGRIEIQDVEAGDYVAQDEVLVVLDSEATEIALKRARARSRLNELELTRIQEMRESGIVPRRDFDRAVFDREVAQSDVKALERELRGRVVKAPFPGVVDQVFQKRDEFVSVGTPLVTLIQVDRLKMIIGIPDQDIRYFSPGDTVAVTVDAYPGWQFNGKIHLIAPRADAATHTFRTEIELDNTANDLKAGMIASAVLVRERHPGSLLIPAFSIISNNESHYVFVEQNGVAVKRPVTVGLQQGNIALVTGGLLAGERLIVAGHRNLQDQTLVNVKEGNS